MSVPSRLIPKIVISTEAAHSLIVRRAAEKSASAFALAFLSSRKGSAVAVAFVVACSLSPNPKIVISTEAPHSLMVRRAVEKSASAFASAFAVAVASR
jgi:hypothetical protein